MKSIGVQTRITGKARLRIGGIAAGIFVSYFVRRRKSVEDQVFRLKSGESQVLRWNICPTSIASMKINDCLLFVIIAHYLEVKATWCLFMLCVLCTNSCAHNVLKHPRCCTTSCCKYCFSRQSAFVVVFTWLRFLCCCEHACLNASVAISQLFKSSSKPERSDLKKEWKFRARCSVLQFSGQDIFL